MHAYLEATRAPRRELARRRARSELDSGAKCAADARASAGREGERRGARLDPNLRRRAAIPPSSGWSIGEKNGAASARFRPTSSRPSSRARRSSRGAPRPAASRPTRPTTSCRTSTSTRAPGTASQSNRRRRRPRPRTQLSARAWASGGRSAHQNTLLYPGGDARREGARARAVEGARHATRAPLLTSRSGRPTAAARTRRVSLARARFGGSSAPTAHAPHVWMKKRPRRGGSHRALAVRGSPHFPSDQRTVSKGCQAQAARADGPVDFRFGFRSRRPQRV